MIAFYITFPHCVKTELVDAALFQFDENFDQRLPGHYIRYVRSFGTLVFNNLTKYFQNQENENEGDDNDEDESEDEASEDEDENDDEVEMETDEDDSQSENEDGDEDEDDFAEESEMLMLDKIEKGPLDKDLEVILRVRKLCRFLRKSPVANGALQDEVKKQLSLKHLKPNIDMKTRWNSMIPMLQSFVKLKGPLLAIWPQIKRPNSLELNEEDFEMAQTIIKVLAPCLIAVRKLCRRDTNLYTADIIMKETINELERLGTTLSLSLASKLRIRYEERRQPVLVSLIKFLSTGILNDKETDMLFKMVSKDRMMNKAKSLLKRLFKKEIPEADDPNVIEDEKDDETFEERIQRKIKESSKPVEKQDDDFLSLNKDWLSFQANGEKSKNLELLYKALLTMKPTSVESERNFSQAKLFLDRLRAGQMDANTLDDLCFCKGYFLNQNLSK